MMVIVCKFFARINNKKASGFLHFPSKALNHFILTNTKVEDAEERLIGFLLHHQKLQIWSSQWAGPRRSRKQKHAELREWLVRSLGGFSPFVTNIIFFSYIALKNYLNSERTTIIIHRVVVFLESRGRREYSESCVLCYYVCYLHFFTTKFFTRVFSS